MGYYTQYTLQVYDHPELIEQLREESGGANYALQEDGSSSEETKWYDHEDDILRFSKKHPGVLFVLNGEGEEGGDLWRKYFQNGKVQVCKARIEYDSFDPSKLS